MSAYFNVKEIGFFSLEQWPATVCAWRGCCIEIFSRAEHSVADCLRTLDAAGVELIRDARNPAPVVRLRALDRCIAQHSFGGHGKVAQERIAKWAHIYETRACLAHGQVSATARGITIQHVTFDGKAETLLPPKHFTRLEMLVSLMDIEAAQRLLHQQLGQIKALAKTVTPLSP